MSIPVCFNSVESRQRIIVVVCCSCGHEFGTAFDEHKYFPDEGFQWLDRDERIVRCYECGNQYQVEVEFNAKVSNLTAIQRRYEEVKGGAF